MYLQAVSSTFLYAFFILAIIIFQAKLMDPQQKIHPIYNRTIQYPINLHPYFQAKGDSRKFEFQNLIRYGKYSRVFKAKLLREEKYCAVKQMYHIYSQKEFKRMLTQFLVLVKFYHPNILRAIDVFHSHIKPQESKVIYFVSELMPRNLREMFNSGMQLSTYQIKKIAYFILKGIQYLHGRRFIHRRISPDNILVNPETLEVKICGFRKGKSFKQVLDKAAQNSSDSDCQDEKKNQGIKNMRLEQLRRVQREKKEIEKNKQLEKQEYEKAMEDGRKIQTQWEQIVIYFHNYEQHFNTVLINQIMKRKTVVTSKNIELVEHRQWMECKLLYDQFQKLQRTRKDIFFNNRTFQAEKYLKFCELMRVFMKYVNLDYKNRQKFYQLHQSANLERQKGRLDQAERFMIMALQIENKFYKTELFHAYQLQFFELKKKPISEIVKNKQQKQPSIQQYRKNLVYRQRYAEGSNISSFYKAPQLIIPHQFYDQKVDIWSFGCILADLFMMRKQFTSSLGEKASLFLNDKACHNKVPQSMLFMDSRLVKIISFMGGPTESSIQFISDEKIKVYLASMQKLKPQSLKIRLNLRNINEQKILLACLKFNPKERLSVNELLKLDFFKEIIQEMNYNIGVQLSGLKNMNEIENKVYELCKSFNKV